MVRKYTSHTRKISLLRQLGSKRFVAACGATVCFIVMVYTTKYTPIDIATAITMIMGVYLGVETIRPSTIPVEDVISVEEDTPTKKDKKDKKDDKH
jgi:hypothetical protein